LDAFIQSFMVLYIKHTHISDRDMSATTRTCG